MFSDVHTFELLGARKILDAVGNLQHLQEIIEEVETGIRNNSDKAFDGSKCLIECTCKTILAERGENVEADIKLVTLVKKTAEKLGINSGLGEDFRNMLSGITTTTQAVANIRNSYGPLSHGKDAMHERIGGYQRYMAAKMAEMVSVMLYQIHKGVPADLLHTRQEYDEDHNNNTMVDEAILIEVDSETNEINFVDYGIFRPSQILYALDRQAYKAALQAAMDNAVNDDEPEPEPEPEHEQEAAG
jgi:hypothetical protein